MATINERFMDFQVAQQIRWIRLGNREAREALRILERVDQQLIGLLARSGIGSAPFTQARLEALKIQVANIINAIHSQQLGPHVVEAAIEAAKHAGDLEANAFRRILPAGLDVTTPNVGVLQSAATLKPFNGAVLGDWVDGLRAADLDRTWKGILDGIISGTTTDDLIRNVVGSKSLRYKDGLREVSRRGAQALVRTSINHATNQGRQAVWEDNIDLIGSVRWVATLDTRTTPICRHRDGRVGPVSLDGPWTPPAGASPLEPPMARPPAHPNCRSTTVAVTKSWKELGFDVEELPPGTRASMDGQVPSDTTYYEWLKRQPKDIQVEVLGKKRWEMWHNDGVSPDRFVNDEGRLLTLDQLKKRMGKDLDTLSASVEPPVSFTPKPNAFLARHVQDRSAQTLNGVAVSDDAVLQMVKERVKDADTFIRVPDKKLSAILRDGRLKTQFEVGRSSGLMNTDVRRNVERNLFGYDLDIPDEKRPIYGYLSDSPIGAGAEHLDFYGDVRLKLKRSTTRNRSTFTIGDSLDFNGAAHYTDDQLVKFGDQVASAVQTLPTPLNRPGIRSVPRRNDKLDYFMTDKISTSRTYWEVQVHDGVSLDDIEEVIFKTKPSAAVEKLLEKNNLPWRIME